ncbi:MAG TPA: 2OG-Fe(II) oxygenase family protein [Duganella sp.]|nr:2OG-Fe(II) oxygenase family protein [Duganella sp.]
MTIHSFPIFNYEDLAAGVVAPDDVFDTLRDHGYFYLAKLERVIPPPLFKTLHEKARQFFGSPLEQKMAYYIGASPNHRGYVPVTEKGAYSDERIRAYEAFDIGYDSAEPAGRARRGFDLIGPNRYPAHVGGMEAALTAYYDANLRLGTEILRLIARASRLEASHFDRHMTRPACQLRLIHYLENDVLVGQDDASMGAHTDYEVFTIMHQSSPGLLAFDRATRTWKNMPVFKNTLLVLAGDMLEFMSGGHIKSLLHRVVSTGEERYSFPFFMNLDFETELTVLPAWGRSDKSVVVGHHLLGQLYRDFPYIKERVDTGQWVLDFPIPSHNQYEQL